MKPHGAAGTRARALSPARVSHRPIKVVPSPAGPATHRPLERFCRRTCRPRVPSPPDLTRLRGVSPSPADWGRPLRWRLPTSGRASEEGCQNTAYLQFVDCGLSWPIGNQIHIPLHRLQKASKSLCTRRVRLQKKQVTARKEPGHSFPSQAGTSCKAGASTARTRDGQPSPSGICRAKRGEAAGRSRHRSPGGPSTRKVSLRPFAPVGHRPSRRAGLRKTEKAKGAGATGFPAQARLTLSWSQRPKHATQPQSPHPATSLSQAPLHPQTRHPRIACTL
jgi:hypothetical protein